MIVFAMIGLVGHSAKRLIINVRWLMLLTKKEMQKIKNALYYFSRITATRGDRDELAKEYFCLARKFPTTESHLITHAGDLASASENGGFEQIIKSVINDPADEMQRRCKECGSELIIAEKYLCSICSRH